MLNLFVRLTLGVALVLVVIFVAGFLLLHIILPAAIIAALILGVLFLLNLFRRRGAAPLRRL